MITHKMRSNADTAAARNEMRYLRMSGSRYKNPREKFNYRNHMWQRCHTAKNPMSCG